MTSTRKDEPPTHHEDIASTSEQPPTLGTLPSTSGSSSTAQIQRNGTQRQWDQAELEALSRSIVRKYDTRLVPMIFTAYTAFWLDRSNIALARVNGLEDELHLVNAQFNVALVCFFAAYMVFNIPGNLIMRRLGGGVFIPILITAWGFTTLCGGFVKSYAGLCVSRAVIGFTEAGFLGGVLLWMSFFYTNEELVARTGIFLSSTPVAGSLGGLLAGGLSRIQVGQYSRWPWIFFIEGALTMLVGIVGFFVLPSTPEQASFLTPDEKLAAKDRMILLDRRSFANRITETTSGSSSDDNTDVENPVKTISNPGKAQSTVIAAPNANLDDKLHRETFRRALLHPVTIFLALGSFFVVECLYSYNLFIPTLLLEMGFDGLINSLMTVPPNFVAFIFTIALTQYAQRKNRLGGSLMLSAATTTLGYVLLLIGSLVGGEDAETGKPRVVTALQYTGTFFAGSGVCASTPMALGWANINANPHYVRAIVLGFMISVGNFAAFISSFVYIKTNAPR